MNFITCRVCQTQNQGENKFCSNCGARLGARTHITCTNCYHRNPLHLLYCDNCGTRLDRSGTDKLGQSGAARDSDRPAQPFSLPTRKPGDTGDLDPESLPDWLRTGEEESLDFSASLQEETPFDVESSADLDPSIVPDWLIDSAVEQNPPKDEMVEESAAEPEETIPDWLAEEVVDSESEADLLPTESAEASEIDWLTALDIDEETVKNAKPPTRPLDKELLRPTDWISHLEQLGELPSDSDLEEDEPDGATWPAGSEELPAIEASFLEDLQNQSPHAASEENELPTWLAAVTDEEIAALRLPDVVEEAGEDIELSDWLRMAEHDPEDDEAAVPEDNPDDLAITGLTDWLSDVNLAETALDAGLPEAAADELPSEESLNDWLTSLHPRSGAPSPLLEDDVEEGWLEDPDPLVGDDADLPGWLESGETAEADPASVDLTDSEEPVINISGFTNFLQEGLPRSLADDEPPFPVGVDTPIGEPHSADDSDDYGSSLPSFDEWPEGAETTAADLPDVDWLEDLSRTAEAGEPDGSPAVEQPAADEALIAELVAMGRSPLDDRGSVDEMASGVAPDWLRKEGEVEKKAAYKQVGGPLHGMLDVIPIAPAMARPVSELEAFIQPLSEPSTAGGIGVTADDADRASIFNQVLGEEGDSKLQPVPKSDHIPRQYRRRSSWIRVIYLLLLLVMFIIFLWLYMPELFAQLPNWLRNFGLG